MIFRFLLPVLFIIIAIASFADGGRVVGWSCVVVAVLMFLIAALLPDSP